MQRPDQIERILSRLKEVWERNPDLSFYELIHNISLTDPNVKELLVHIRMDGIESGPELYVTSQKSVGDRAFEQRLETYIRMYHPELLPKPNNSTFSMHIPGFFVWTY